MRIFLILFLISCIGCSTIRQSHTQNVHAFASSAKTLSAAPGLLYQNISDFRHDLKLIESSTVFSTDKVVTQLNQAIAFKKAFEENAQKVNDACNLIGTYADCLLSLVDQNYYQELNKQSIDLALQLNSAFDDYNFMFNKKIPANVGGLLAMVVNKIGSIKLKQLQKKYLKEFVQSGSVIINDVCDYFTNEMSVNLELEMSILDNDFSNAMRTFYNGIEQYQRTLQNVNPYDYLRNYNPLYLDMKELLTELHFLHKQTIEAMHKIRQAHEKLKITVETTTEGELLLEVKELYKAMRDIKSASDKINRKSKIENSK